MYVQAMSRLIQCLTDLAPQGPLPNCTDDMPSGLPLPYDIERLIILHSASDRSTLASLSLVSRDFNHDVDPFLWRTVWLPREESVQLTLAACEAICRVPRRAKCVRKLNYGGDRDIPSLIYEAYASPQSYYPPKIHGSPTIAMERALRALVNLEELYFSPSTELMDNLKAEGTTSFCAVLDSLALSSQWPVYGLQTPVPFQLKRLDANRRIAAPQKFLLEQLSIESVHANTPMSFRFLTFGSEEGLAFFPNVFAVSGDPIFLQQILPNRPSIRHVTLTQVYHGSFNAFSILIPALLKLDYLIHHISLPAPGLDGEAMFESFRTASQTVLKAIQTISLRPDAAKGFLAGASSVNHTNVEAGIIEQLGDTSSLFDDHGMVKLRRNPDGERDNWDLGGP